MDSQHGVLSTQDGKQVAFEVGKAEPPNSVSYSSQTPPAVPVLVGLLTLTQILSHVHHHTHAGSRHDTLTTSN